MHLLHVLLGFFVLIVTVIFAMKVTKEGFFKEGGFHNTLGAVFVIITFIGAMTGSIAAGVQRFHSGQEWTVTEKSEIVGKIHRYTGYLMLFLGNLTLASGIGHYYGDILQGDSRKTLAPLSLVTFVLLVAIFETIYRLRNRYSLR